MDRFSNFIQLRKNCDCVSSDNKGFTVTELVLALAIMTIVMPAMIGLLLNLNRAYTTQSVAAGVQQATRAGMNIMTRDIRMAGLNPLDFRQIGIVEASAHKIRFQLDMNASGEIETGQDEDITYLLNNNNQLIRQKDGNSRSNRSLIDHVKTLTFRYYDKNDEETSVLKNICTVELSLTVREPAGRKKYLSRSYTTRVICRNLIL